MLQHKHNNTLAYPINEHFPATATSYPTFDAILCYKT